MWDIALPAYIRIDIPGCASLPSAGQHPSYDDCLEVKTEYYQNCSVLDCVTQCSQSAAHLYEQFLQVKQIGFVTLGPLHCAYSWVLVRFKPFLRCFDTVGLVIWPVKIVPKMTYNLLSGTLSLYTTRHYSLMWLPMRGRAERYENAASATGLQQLCWLSIVLHVTSQ